MSINNNLLPDDAIISVENVGNAYQVSVPGVKIRTEKQEKSDQGSESLDNAEIVIKKRVKKNTLSGTYSIPSIRENNYAAEDYYYDNSYETERLLTDRPPHWG